MAQFGMLQEHKDVLRQNLVQLVRNLNPEAVIYRLSQLGILTQCNVENILANPTRHAQSSALLHLVPSKGPAAFQNFCRALSCTGQQRLRTLINPDGNKKLIFLSQ